MATTASIRTMPVIDVDPFDPAVLADPYPFHAMLRDAGSIVWLSAHGTYGTGRFDATEAIFKDWQHFRSSSGAGLSDIRKPGAWREPGPIVEADPPRHTGIRKTMMQIISPRVIRGWREAFAAEAQRLCDAVVAGPAEIDAVPALAEAYVLKVFPDALGLNVDRTHLITVGNYNFNALGPKNALFLKSQADLDAIADWFKLSQSREGMVAGGFGEMIFKAEEQGDLPPGTASPMVRTFLRGGMDTTISGIGFSLLYLAERPEIWAMVKADPARITSVFEEVLRLESPVATLFRTTGPEPFDFMGHRLEPDTKVQLFPGSANRDPDHWERPDSFDADRKLGLHASFGMGPHTCIGRMIAQMEAQFLLEALIERIERIELAGQTRLRPLNALRTLDTLPLRLTRT